MLNNDNKMELRSKAGENNYDVYNFDDAFSLYENIPSICIKESAVNHPKFSIIIPTYNRPKTLKVTIDSAIYQFRYDDYYEILIISNDPKSIDIENDTNKLISSYHDEKISFYVNSQNIGLCGNWNRGSELAKGDYIVMIHDDDILGPFVLYSLNQVLNKYPSTGVIGCGNVKFVDKIPEFQEPQKIYYHEITKRSFFFGYYIGIAGMTYRKDILKKIGGFNEKFYPNEDTNFIYQVLIISTVISIDNQLTGYRVGINATLSCNLMDGIITHMELLRRNIAEHEKFAKRWLDRYDKDYLIQYIHSAENNWKIEVDGDSILSRFGLDNSSTSHNFSMKVAESIYGLYFRISKQKNITLKGQIHL